MLHSTTNPDSGASEVVIRKAPFLQKAFALRLGFIFLITVMNGALLFANEKRLLLNRPYGVAHLRFGHVRKPVQMRMYMGVQPKPLPCPNGKYRKAGGGATRGECEYCPRGVYGDTPGLTTSECTAKCPKGTYNDKLGAKSILECKICPPGVYGSSPGLTSSACTAPCPLGKYTMKAGLQSVSECDDCPANYRGPQGMRGNNPYFGNEGGVRCDRFINGKTIQTGRDSFTAATLETFLASTRTARNTINDNT